jgi:hypothetical protein
MGSILTPAIDAIRQIAIQSNGVRGYQPQHHRNGGECAVELDTLPVLVKYELTSIGAEVVEVSIHGAVICAQSFAADVLQQWARDCEQSREAEGWPL